MSAMLLAKTAIPGPARAGSGDEAVILAALAAGDPGLAFTRLQSAYARRGYALAYRLVRDAALAEDVMQDALLQVFLGLQGLRQHDSLHAWVMTVIAHRALDELRRRGRRQRHLVETDTDHETPDPRADAETALATAADHRALEASLTALPSSVRAAVLLRFGHGCSFEQIGAALGEQADTVRARIKRALPRLRGRLRRLGVGPVPGLGRAAG